MLQRGGREGKEHPRRRRQQVGGCFFSLPAFSFVFFLCVLIGLFLKRIVGGYIRSGERLYYVRLWPFCLYHISYHLFETETSAACALFLLPRRVILGPILPNHGYRRNE